MKKSQINSQVFIYLLAIIVIGVIALIAFKGIGKILATKCTTEKEMFKKDFAQSIKDHSSPGEVRTKSLQLPCGAIAICLYDESSTNPGDIKYQKPIIEGLAGENNVFLIKQGQPISGSSVEAFPVPKIKLNARFVCISGPAGTLNYRLEGLGVGGTRVLEG